MILYLFYLQEEFHLQMVWGYSSWNEEIKINTGLDIFIITHGYKTFVYKFFTSISKPSNKKLYATRHSFLIKWFWNTKIMLRSFISERPGIINVVRFQFPLSQFSLNSFSSDFINSQPYQNGNQIFSFFLWHLNVTYSHKLT
jgi:hypothetical protein